jgi:hypothetical protein
MQLLSLARNAPLRVHERALVRRLLAKSDQSDPLVGALSQLLAQLEATPAPRPGPISRAILRVRAWYARIVEDPRFTVALITVFVAVATATVVQVVLDGRRIFDGSETVHVISVAGLASSLLASGMIAVGLLRLRDSRVHGLRWFDHALLIQVFFTEPFAFLQHQFAAVFGLLLNLALLLVVQTMIRAECHLSLLADDPLESAGSDQLPLSR